jgi:hypothetical protein
LTCEGAPQSTPHPTPLKAARGTSMGNLKFMILSYHEVAASGIQEYRQ